MVEIIPLLAVFAPLFSPRVWSHAEVLLVGAMLTPGVCTVTAILLPHELIDLLGLYGFPEAA